MLYDSTLDYVQDLVSNKDSRNVRETRIHWVDSNLKKLQEKLLDRNFPNTLISEKFEMAKSLDRKAILRRKPKNKSDDRVMGYFYPQQG